MADNYVANAGSGGSTFAADDIGPGVLYPRIKLIYGPDNTNSGDVATSNPLPVAAMHDAGQMVAAGVILTPTFAKIAASSSGDNTLVASVSSKHIRVVALYLVANAAVNAKFQSGAGGTDVTGLAYLAANTGFVLPFNPAGWFETAVTTLLNLNLSGAVAVGGALTYVEVA